MKIPAHLLSPAANSSKGAQSAPVQNVAEFLNEQSDAPKDFFSALKSLQNLVKPQKANENQMGASKDPASLGSNSVATKVAELKFVDHKNENVEPQESDASQELVQSKEDEAFKLNEPQPNTKTATIERSALLNDKMSETGNSKNANDAEQLPSKLDEVELESKLARSVDVDLAKNFGTRSPAEIATIAKTMAQRHASIDPTLENTSNRASPTETVAPLAERKSMELNSTGLNAHRGAESAASMIGQTHRPARAIDEDSRGNDGLRLATEHTPIKQNGIAAGRDDG